MGLIARADPAGEHRVRRVEQHHDVHGRRPVPDDGTSPPGHRLAGGALVAEQSQPREREHGPLVEDHQRRARARAPAPDEVVQGAQPDHVAHVGPREGLRPQAQGEERRQRPHGVEDPPAAGQLPHACPHHPRPPRQPQTESALAGARGADELGDHQRADQMRTFRSSTTSASGRPASTKCAPLPDQSAPRTIRLRART